MIHARKITAFHTCVVDTVYTQHVMTMPEIITTISHFVPGFFQSNNNNISSTIMFNWEKKKKANSWWCRLLQLGDQCGTCRADQAGLLFVYKGLYCNLSSNRFILRSKWIFDLKVTKVSVGTPQASAWWACDGSEVKVTLTFGQQIPAGIPGRSKKSAAEGKRTASILTQVFTDRHETAGFEGRDARKVLLKTRQS